MAMTSTRSVVHLMVLAYVSGIGTSSVRYDLNVCDVGRVFWIYGKHDAQQ